ncbi:GlsB/YeaQ/YmgE family stress response membrane protein [soil metagenome]
MSIIAWIVLGLIVGVIAKAILPGRQGGGIIITLILGVVGALLGGFLAGAIFHVDMGGFFDIKTWVIAVIGAIIVLLIYGALTRGSRRRA